MDLRDLIAETLAGHRRRLSGLTCQCGRQFVLTGRPGDVEAAWDRHVADVLLAALGDRVLPEGGSMWRPVTAEEEAADVWVPDDPHDEFGTGQFMSREDVSRPRPVEPCPEGFHWIGQPWSSCDKCGQPAWEHAGMAVTATPMKSPFDDQPLVLRPWTEAELDAWRPVDNEETPV